MLGPLDGSSRRVFSLSSSFFFFPPPTRVIFTREKLCPLSREERDEDRKFFLSFFFFSLFQFSNATTMIRPSALAEKRGEWAGIFFFTQNRKIKKKKTRKNNNNLSSKLSKDSFSPYIHFLGFFFFLKECRFFFFLFRLYKDRSDFGRHVLTQRKEATRFCQQRGYFFSL